MGEIHSVIITIITIIISITPQYLETQLMPDESIRKNLQTRT